MRERRSAFARLATRARIRLFAIDARIVDPWSVDLSVDSDAWRQYRSITQRSLLLLSQLTGGLALLEPAALPDGLAGINRTIRGPF